jgi:hypothetical protein
VIHQTREELDLLALPGVESRDEFAHANDSFPVLEGTGARRC